MSFAKRHPKATKPALALTLVAVLVALIGNAVMNPPYLAVFGLKTSSLLAGLFGLHFQDAGNGEMIRVTVTQRSENAVFDDLTTDWRKVFIIKDVVDSTVATSQSRTEVYVWMNAAIEILVAVTSQMRCHLPSSTDIEMRTGVEVAHDEGWETAIGFEFFADSLDLSQSH